MSSIEHVCGLIGRSLARDQRPSTSKDELWLRALAIGNSLQQADIQNLFDSIASLPSIWRSTTAIFAARWDTPNTDFGQLFYFIYLFIFTLKILSFIYTNASHLCDKFHFILIIPSWWFIFYKQQDVSYNVTRSTLSVWTWHDQHKIYLNLYI